MIRIRPGKLVKMGASCAKIGVALLAAWHVPGLRAQEPLVVSRGGREPRVATRIGQPGQERHTHRGWEVYGEQMVVLANSSQADARLAAERFQAALGDSRRQLELLVGPLPRGNRARGAVQITIDTSTWKGETPPPVIRRSGMALSLYLSVGPGQPPLERQIDRLQDAASVMVVETYLSGPAVPESLRVGLASFLAPQADVLLASDAGRSSAGTSLIRSAQSENAGQIYQKLRADSVPRGRHPWTSADRDTPNVRDRDEGVDPSEVAAAKELVEFLLTGYDGRFAAAFGNVLRAAVRQQEVGLERQNRDFREATTPAGEPSPLAQFVDSLQPQFEAWQKDPLVGLPVWTPLEKDNPQLAERQRELFFVLRLLNRAVTTAVRPVEPKVIELTANGATSRAATPSTGRPIDLAQWVRTESMNVNRWAIVDPNGLLVWNHDTEPLQKRLSIGSGRYSAAWSDGRIVVREALGGARTLEAWLEPNPADKLAPVARFAVRAEN